MKIMMVKLTFLYDLRRHANNLKNGTYDRFDKAYVHLTSFPSPSLQPSHSTQYRYDPTWMKNQNVLVTGSNRGIGLALTRELVNWSQRYATCRKPSKSWRVSNLALIVTDVDVTSETKCKVMASKISYNSMSSSTMRDISPKIRR